MAEPPHIFGDDAPAEQAGPHRRDGRRRRMWAVAGIMLLAVVIGTGWFVKSSYFNNWVRDKLIAEIDEDTGGRASLGGIKWNLSKLEFELSDFTVRGTEAPDQVPLLHVDLLSLRLK